MYPPSLAGLLERGYHVVRRLKEPRYVVVWPEPPPCHGRPVAEEDFCNEPQGEAPIWPRTQPWREG